MNKEFGNLIRQAREDRGLSQADLAERMGVDHTYISKVERGQVPSRAKVIDWLQYLGIDDPPGRLPYLLAAGYLSYEDVAQAAEVSNLGALDQTKALYRMIDEVRQSQDREEPTNTEAMQALQEKVGQEAYSKLTEFAELLGKSNLDKDTANRVLDSTLNLAKTLLDAMGTPASREVPMTNKRK